MPSGNIHDVMFFLCALVQTVIVAVVKSDLQLASVWFLF